MTRMKGEDAGDTNPSVLQASRGPSKSYGWTAWGVGRALLLCLDGIGEGGLFSRDDTHPPGTVGCKLTSSPLGPSFSPTRSTRTGPSSGFRGAGAVLAALHHRRSTGEGQYIDLSEQEAAIPLVGAALMDFAMNGRLPERIGNRSPWAAPQGCYRCRGDDDWLVISIENDEAWGAF